MPPLLVIPAMPRIGEVAREAPLLPALCEMLRLSDGSAPDAEWRAGLLRDLGAMPVVAVPEAAIAACALGIPAGSGVCLAAPVHAVAGMHRVHLHAAGILGLPEDDRSALAAGFASQFGPELRLHPAGEQWLMEADCAVAADDTDPAEWIGAPLERRLASSPQQRLLRRLGAEIEMWLADLPLNAQRQRRGQLPVNLLWLWGGGLVRAPGQLPSISAARIHGAPGDAWLAGCAALAGLRVEPLPSVWSGAEGSRAVFVLPAGRDFPTLAAWETAWFMPALDDLRAGRIASLDLRLGRRLHHVRAGRFRRLLRRSRPWWQRLSA